MDYFKLLLEAFSDLHDRRLRLLEQDTLDPEAVKLATTARAAGEKLTFSQAKAKPQTPPSGKPLYVWQTQGKHTSRSGFKPGKVVYNDSPTPSFAKTVDDDWNAFVAKFAKEGESTTTDDTTTDTNTDTDTQEIPPEVIPTDEEILAQQLAEAAASKDTTAKVAANFRYVDSQIENLWKNLPEEFKREEYTARGQSFRSYLVGERAQSFQRQLLSRKFSLSLGEGDIYSTESYNLSDDQMSRISDSFRDLVGIVSKNECDKDNNVIRNFSKSSNTGDMIVTPKGDVDKSFALSFSKSSGRFLKDLSEAAARICGTEVQSTRVTAPVTGGGGSSNNIRGTGFEMFELIKSLVRLKVKGGALESLIKEKSNELVENFNKLKEEVEQIWLNEASMTAIDSDDKQQLVELARVLADGDKAKKLLASMSDQSTSRRNPMLSLPVGDQVGKGKRQDNLEFYASEEEALAAAARSGLQGVVPMSGRVEDFFPDKDADIRDALLKDKVFAKGQEVFTFKVSLKNYLSLDANHPAKYGGGRYSTFNNLINADDALDIQANENFVSTINDNLQMTPDDFKDLQTYSKSLFSIGKDIFKTAYKTKTKIGNKSVTVNSGEIIAKAILESLTKKSFGDVKEAEKNDLLISAAKLVGSLKDETEKKAAYERVQIHMNDRLQAKKIQKDLNSRNKKTRLNAQRLLAYKMFHAGGSDDDNLICDYRGLDAPANRHRGDSFMFKQNDPLRDAWRSVQSGDGQWSLEMTDSGQTKLTKKMPKGYTGTPVTLTMKSSIRSNKTKDPETGVKKKTGYSSGYIVEISRAVMEQYSNNDYEEDQIVETETLEILNRIESLLKEMTNRIS